MMSERTIFFLAVSTEAQATDDRESLPEQRRALDDAARRFNWKVVDVIEVPGFSRSWYTYAEFSEAAAAAGMLDALRLFDHWKRRDFDVLAAINTTRLGRDQSILAEVIRRTIDAGARVYTVEGGWIDAQNQRMHIAMSGYSTGAEMDELRRRYQFGIRGRVARGLPPGRTPATHLLIRDPRGKAERLIVDESKRRLFNDIYELLCLERAVIRDMEPLLEARGHGALGGRMVDSWLRNPYTWGHSAVRFIPVNERRHWQWVYNPSVPIPEGVEIWRDTHEAVWTGDQGAAMRAELDRRHATSGSVERRYGGHRYSGLLRCANCGATGAYHIQRRRYRYLRCTLNCGAGEVREEVVDAYIGRLLDRIVAGTDIRDLLRVPPDDRTARLDRVQAEIDQVTAQTRALIRLQATAPTAVLSIYDDELHDLAARLDALKSEHARLSSARPTAEPDPAMRSLRQHGAAWFWALPVEDQNALLHMLFGPFRLAISGRGVEAIALPPGS